MRLLRIFALVALCLALVPAPALAVTGYDSSYASESAFVMINPGETKAFQVVFVNTGTLTWTKGGATQVDLAACLEDKVTCNAQDPGEAGWNSGWLSATRYATTTQAVVAPAGFATFAYNIRAPGDATGTHRFNGDLVVASSGARIHPEGYYQDATVNAIGTTGPPPAVTGPTTPTGTLKVNGQTTATGCPGEDFTTTFTGSGLLANTTYQLTATRDTPPPASPPFTLSNATTGSNGTFTVAVPTTDADAPSSYTIVTTQQGVVKTNTVQVTFFCPPVILRAEPGVFDQTEQGTVSVTAAWISEGSNEVLKLTKECPATIGQPAPCTATVNASSGAEITVNGEHYTLPITELGFDYKNGTWCGAGAPRFNVYTAADFSTALFFGCAGGTSQDLGNGWTRVRFGAVAGTVFALEIIFDEGNDNGPGSGSTILDNIDVSGVIITNSAGTALP